MQQEHAKLLRELSELEDRYAQLLTEEAPDRELAQLWTIIRDRRRMLKQLETPVADQRPLSP